MKKKIVMALLIAAMTASVFAGCGNRMEGDGKVHAMADAESAFRCRDGLSVADFDFLAY